MKNRNFLLKNNKGILKYFIITAVVIISWFPVLYIPFINDDIQILGYNSGKSLLSIFKPFWTPDVSIFYWRPLGNIIHPIILFISGFEPFPFRLASLILYVFCCIVILYCCIKLNFNIESALILVVLFAILPSHEFQVAWIADQGETLLAALLILSFINYYSALQKDYISKKHISYFLLFFTASLLVKELAFVGIFIPVIAFIAKKEKVNIDFKIILKHVIIALGILIVVLLYRFIVIGGSPFNSPNFNNSGPITWIKNFFIYIPLAFFPPNFLEFLNDNLKNLLVIIPTVIVLIFCIYLFFNVYTKLSSEKKKLILAGLIWFCVFIIPALLKLMRWYVFTASIGLIWSLTVIFEFYWQKLNYKKIILSFTLPIFVLLIIYNFSLMQRWASAGNKFEKSLYSLVKIKNEIKHDSVFVWCVPDKLNRIPMMKLGVQQSIQWELKNNSLEVYSPLRAELINDKSRISLIKKSDSVFVFHLYGGRFLPIDGKSEAIIKKEFLSFKNERVTFNINTYIKDNQPESIATVKLNPQNLNFTQLYYNGNRFVKIE